MSKIVETLKATELDYKNRIYNIAYLIIVCKAFYAYSDLVTPVRTQLILNACNLGLMGLLAYKIIFYQKYNIRQILICLALALLTFYTDQKTYMFMMLPDFALIAALQDVDFKQTMKIVYKVEATIIAIHLALYPLFYFFNRSALSFSIRGDQVDKPRHQLLLSHANIASMLILWTILGYIYAEYEKINTKKIILCWLTYVFIYFFTRSNSGLIILTLTTILLLLKQIYGERVDGLVLFLSRYLYMILAVVFIVMVLIFPTTTGALREAWLGIDKFFTGRLRYGAYAYYKGGFTIFGQHIPYIEKEYWQGMWYDMMNCDNAYIWMAVSYGLIYLFIIGFLFWKYSKQLRFEERIIIIAYSLYTMMELYVTYMYFCFAVIMIGQYLWKKWEPGGELHYNGGAKTHHLD